MYQANLGLEQDDESGTDTDEDGEMIKAKTQAAAFAVLDPGARPVAKKRPSGEHISTILDLAKPIVGMTICHDI